MLEWDEVAVYIAKHLGAPSDLRGAFGNIKKLGSFLEDLGWLV